jgi:Mg2+-importing ATPase
MKFSECTTKSIRELFEILGTSATGLSEKEAMNRQKQYGLNEVKVREAGVFDIFARQFRSPFVYLLFVAAMISFLIGERLDSVMIFIILSINVFLGFFQEYRTERAIRLLKNYIPQKGKVLRDGKKKIMDKAFLVPGDIVLLAAGDIVPADLRLVKARNFLVDESVLTGESSPVVKVTEVLPTEAKEVFEAKNIVFASTSVTSGEAEGVVIATGRETVFGQIEKMISGFSRESIYEKNLLKFSRLILRIVVATIILVFLANFMIRKTENLIEFSIFSIALVVTIIPEALPLIAVFSFSQGALKLAKEKVVVKRLSSIEDLGNIDILCTDKTGTITENKLTLESIVSPDKNKCLLYGLLASSFIGESGDGGFSPFDSALFAKSPKEIRESLKKFKEVAKIPFDPYRLRNSFLVEDENNHLIVIVRGAPETIIQLSSRFEGNLSPEQLGKRIAEEGRQGRRILAVAYKELNQPSYSEADEKELTFLGYFSFVDPLRKTAKETITLAKRLGVKIKILTGDSKEVAGWVGRELGLLTEGEEVVLGETLDSLPEEELQRTCEISSVFARVSPQTKFKIVEALQKKFEVGFLGEGINDVPVLKIANVAIVVDTAVDIAREAADIVLLQKGLSVIVEGIKTGRSIFSNINKYIKCTLASNFGNFYSIALISLYTPFLPLLPVQILLINLLTDLPLIAIATDNIDVAELKKPKVYQLTRFVVLISVLGLISTIFDFIFFGIFHKLAPELLRTLWFIENNLTEIILIFSIRTSQFFLKAKSPSAPLVTLALLTGMITILLPFTEFGRNVFHLVLPSLSGILIVFCLVFLYFIGSEFAKLLYFRYYFERRKER